MSLLFFSMSVFFFFQAEDGIRDTSVTGVQTCALPISPAFAGATASPARRACPSKPPPDAHHESVTNFAIRGKLLLAVAFHAGRIRRRPRSEERRVGKECRSRWSPHD